MIFIIICAGILFLEACHTENDGTDTTGALEEQVRTRFYNEIVPEASLPCFAGAYYRKAVSSVDNWLGIEGKVVLPQIDYDSIRVNPLKPGQFLDNFSVYLGGNSDGQETDIGLTWEVIKDEAGNISSERKAFRPFLRRSSHKSGQTALYKNAPAESRYYWFPGDTVLITVQTVKEGILKLTLAGNGKKYEEEFESAGYSFTQKAQFKRVNAIDQVANEGKPVQTTKAKSIGAKWLNVSLFRYYKSDAIKVPMHPLRFTDMRCPQTSHFKIGKTSEDSGENIDIFGTPQ